MLNNAPIGERPRAPSPAAGTKHDTNKPPMELLDRHALEEIAQVLAYGESKYSADNWRGGIEYRRLTGAILRHAMAIADGEDIDPESGRPHAAHAACECMFLLWMMKHRPDLDNRTVRTHEESAKGDPLTSLAVAARFLNPDGNARPPSTRDKLLEAAVGDAISSAKA